MPALPTFSRCSPARPYRPARRSLAPSSGRWRGWLLSLAMAGLSPAADAQPGYAQIVKNACAKAGRPVPGFSVNNCNICHQNANHYRAYQSGNYLDVLCQIGVEPVQPGNNTAPVLDHLASPQTVRAGQLFQLAVFASDAEDDVLKLSAKRLPPGASLKAGPKTNGKWMATLRWKPKKKQAGKTFTVQFTATERRRNPRLTATQFVSLFVAEPGASVQALTVEQARFEAGALSVAGTLRPVPAAPVDVLIRDATGALLGQARSVQGHWSAVIALETQPVPCAIRTEVDGATLAVAPVLATGTGCR